MTLAKNWMKYCTTGNCCCTYLWEDTIKHVALLATSQWVITRGPRFQSPREKWCQSWPKTQIGGGVSGEVWSMLWTKWSQRTGWIPKEGERWTEVLLSLYNIYVMNWFTYEQQYIEENVSTNWMSLQFFFLKRNNYILIKHIISPTFNSL